MDPNAWQLRKNSFSDEFLSNEQDKWLISLDLPEYLNGAQLNSYVFAKSSKAYWMMERCLPKSLPVFGSVCFEVLDEESVEVVQPVDGTYVIDKEPNEMDS